MISIVMGSQSDWNTLSHSENILKELDISYEKIVSAHRTPERLYNYAKKLEETEIEVVIAGAGGAAHLPGMIASLTSITVLGVPIETKTLKELTVWYLLYKCLLEFRFNPSNWKSWSNKCGFVCRLNFG